MSLDPTSIYELARKYNLELETRKRMGDGLAQWKKVEKYGICWEVDSDSISVAHQIATSTPAANKSKAPVERIF